MKQKSQNPLLRALVSSLLLIFFLSCVSGPSKSTAPFTLPPPNQDLPVTAFDEVWAYLVAGREFALDLSLPLTDIAYFGADVDSYGNLVGIPNFVNIAHFPGRKHLVAASTGRAVTYFILLEGRPEREALIRTLLEASAPYDGLQINFENVPPQSSGAYISFLRELRAGLRPDQMLSVAIAARVRTLQNDVYDYARILPIVDRMLVMAYDEHWSTSAPGPIASMGWSQRVARYALDTIGSEKLIMGLPFYGRRWGNLSPNMAFIHSGIETIMREEGITEVGRDNGVPHFRYSTQVDMTVYYEDEYSLSARLQMYRDMGVRSVGFWRLGQETPAIWPQIRVAP
ncbi:MAG: glycosyl hydrolase family 18 protein [Treponema sp.]|nr:glycosyl hydrolase family 18 protein [Treponema sp.]